MKQQHHRSLFAYIKNFIDPVIQLVQFSWQKHGYTFILLVLPLVFLINTSIIHEQYGAFFQNTVDPEYFHMYNGVAVGGGNLAVEYIAHPGTPMQFMIALSTRIIHFFQSDSQYPQDFIDNPEKYIHAANLFMNILIALVLFIGGLKAKQYSGSLFAGLMIQLGPFGNASIPEISGRLIPEAMMVIPLLLVCIMIIRHIYQKDHTNNFTREMVVYGLIIGFGMACKISFFPVVVIPLILYQTPLKQKIKFLFYTVLFTAIFAYPIVFEFKNFWEWISGMFTHSGMHGGGSKGLIDFSAITQNFTSLYNHDKLFFYIIFFSLLLNIVFSIPFFAKKGLVNHKIKRAIYAVNIALAVSIVFTLKHFALHYFMPFYIFKYFLLLLCTLSILQLQQYIPSKKFKPIVHFVILLATLFITYGEIKQIRITMDHISTRKEKQQQVHNTIVPLVNRDSPIILTGPYYGTPFVQFAHYNGFMMSYGLKGMFKPMLQEKFPNSYLFVSWHKKFYYWDEFVDFEHIIDQADHSFYIYIGKESRDDLDIIENRLWQVIDKNLVTIKVLFHDDHSGEKLIEVIVPASH